MHHSIRRDKNSREYEPWKTNLDFDSLCLGQSEHVQDDLVDRVIVEERLDGRVVDDDREEQLAVLSQSIHGRVAVGVDGRVAAPSDHRLEQFDDGLVGPSERLEGGLVDEQTEQLADVVRQGVLGHGTGDGRHGHRGDRLGQLVLLAAHVELLVDGSMTLAQVTHQTVLTDEGAPALGARLGFLAHVRQQVQLERRLDGERLVARGTGVRLDARVQHEVAIAILLAHERLLASIARVRLHLVVHVALVHEQAGSTIERLAALVAVETVLARVMKQVGLERAELNERLAAVLALVRTDARVRALVTLQRARKREAGGALLALVRSLARVHSSVLLQRVVRRKRLLAHVALERTLTRVHALVYAQHRRTVEVLLAEIALVLLDATAIARVDAQMLAQVVVPREHLAAHLARETGQRNATAVGLVYVTEQVILAAELFLALFALVRFETGVDVHVTRQGSLVGATSAAHVAPVRRALHVYHLLMAMQRGLQLEHLRAFVAGEPRLAGIRFGFRATLVRLAQQRSGAGNQLSLHAVLEIFISDFINDLSVFFTAECIDVFRFGLDNLCRLAHAGHLLTLRPLLVDGWFRRALLGVVL